jgi:hypothetical protein
VVVELLEQHEQQQRDDHPDGGFGKHIIHEDSSDANASFPIFSKADFTALSSPCHARPPMVPMLHYKRFLFPLCRHGEHSIPDGYG